MDYSLKPTLSYLLGLTVLGTNLLVNIYFTSEFFEYPKFLFLLMSVASFTVLCFWDWAGKSSKNNRKMLQNRWVLILGVISFLIGNLLAYWNAADQSVALVGAEFRYMGLLTNLHLLLFGISTYYCFWRYGREIKIEKWLVVILMAVCATAFFPIFQGGFGERVYGTLGNPNYLAATIIALLPLVLVVRGPQFAKALAGLFGIYVLFLTGSRSAWIAVTAALLFVGALDYFANKGRRFMLTGLIALAVLISLVGVQRIASVDELERFSVESENLTSLDTRISLWKGGLEMFFDSPILGYGQDQIKGNINSYIPNELTSDPTFYIDRTHSELIDLVLMTGAFGVLGYIIIMLSALFVGVRKLVAGDAGVLGAVMVGFISLNLYHLVNFSSISSSVLAFLLAGWILGASSKSN